MVTQHRKSEKLLLMPENVCSVEVVFALEFTRFFCILFVKYIYSILGILISVVTFTGGSVMDNVNRVWNSEARCNKSMKKTMSIVQ